MTRPSSGTRALLLACTVAALWVSWSSQASAATLEATCANLQAQIDVAAKSGGADTVVLGEVCKGGATLPKEASFTLRGAPGTTAGFTGEGTTGPLLSSPEPTGPMTIEHLTFEHARDTTSGSGGGLELFATELTLRDDAFVDDVVESATGARGGGAAVSGYAYSHSTCQPGEPPALTVVGTSFVEDRAVTTAAAYTTQGGGLYATNGCDGRPSVLEGDSFERDRAEAHAVEAASLTAGGALSMLSFGAEGGATIPVLQSGDVFDSNAASAPGSNLGGGGEWLEGMSLDSVGDRFSRNSLSGTTGSAWSWGAGLGILGTECNSNPIESTLEDAVVAANSIGAGTPADLGGAGVYVGCEGANPASSNHLRLLDSTVTANSVSTAGGVAGIDGHSQDQLAIANSIVAGNLGGSQLAGFTGAGGALSSAYSDVCDEAGTAPLAGAGDICADPKLADDGNGSSYDVHEAAASPTIDAGSNALVPSGLATDFFGGSRILSGHALLTPCSPGAVSAYAPAPAVVDMGADEFGPVAVPAIAILCPGTSKPPAGKPSSAFGVPALHVGRAGRLILTFRGLPTGTLAVKGTFTRTRFVTERVKGRRRRVARHQVVVYGSYAHTGATATVELKPTKTALAYLKAHKRLTVQLTITFTAPGATPYTRRETVLVRYVKPPKHR